jgi:hypothetical protein
VARLLLKLATSREEGRRGMLIADINGEFAPRHPSARLFIEEGFAVTAMGLQARTERLRPSSVVRGVPSAAGGRPRGHGIGIAPLPRGGAPMDQTREQEHEHVRRSNDRDQELERHGEDAPHNIGYDEAADGRHRSPRQGDVVENGRDVDPDSAASQVDREDTPND